MDVKMNFLFIVIWLFMFLLFISAVAALIWAIVTGQFQNFQKGAQSIFDEEEPIGHMTDSFPNQNQQENENKKGDDGGHSR